MYTSSLGGSTLTIILLGCILFTAGSESLYGPNDKVVLLNKDNFVSQVHGSKTAWMIEFYSSWCGHCINFAPIFKDFSAKVHEWRHAIQIGVVDCADDSNTNICRTYEVSGYPTLKFFPPNSLNTSKGVERASYQKSIESLMRDTAKFAASQKELSSIFRSVNFGEEASAFKNNPNAKAAIYINPSKHRYGTALFLTLHKNLTQLGIPLLLSSEESNLASFLKKGDTQVSPLEIRGHDVFQDAEIVMKHIQTLDSKNKDKGKSPAGINFDINRRRYTVYVSDIENALMYSLKHEVATNSVISGDKLSVLQEYVDILSKYYPGRKITRDFIKELKAWIFGHNDIVKGSDLENHFNALSKRLGAFSDTPKDWQGCKGSSKRYGGYPCSLWTLFHAVSVNHAGVTSDKKATKLDVLTAMRGYIKEFFGCRDCARHFEQEWLKDDPSKRVLKADDAIIWLWETHNKVNLRLSGDLSDDPSFPKFQFPDSEHCSKCYIEDGSKSHKFDMRNVLEFLKSLYGEKMDYKGLSKELNEHEVPSGTVLPGPFIHPKDGKPYEPSAKGISLWFSTLDISLLLLFYFIAIALIFFAFKKIFFKRKCKMFRGTYISNKV